MERRLDLGEGREFLLELLFPGRCPVCDGILRFRKEYICPSCQDTIKYIREPVCMRCGKPLGKEEEYCRDCAHKRHYYRQGAAVFEYSSIASSIHRFKYGGRQEYARFFGKTMALRLGRQLEMWKAQALVPVPVHASRKRRRGYNQAELLAAVLAQETGIPLRTDLIRRVKKTIPQKELNSVQRQNNLKKAFKILKNDVKLSTIIIIDDIYTTGSTVDAMAAVLLEHGAENIYYAALAIGSR
ncbi:MAG: ComF family protein [Lachnospiraceae bacterium]|nr:ComF family protein [Lachnospiraceae bacterium]